MTRLSRVWDVSFFTVDAHKSLPFDVDLPRKIIRIIFCRASLFTFSSSTVDVNFEISSNSLGPMRSAAAMCAELFGPMMKSLAHAAWVKALIEDPPLL